MIQVEIRERWKSVPQVVAHKDSLAPGVGDDVVEHLAAAGGVGTNARRFVARRELQRDLLGFRGGGEQPIIPNHLFVDQIIAGRQGTALSLSALYVILGRKLGIPLECVALMDYFVVGVFDHPRDSEPMLYLDPLHRGRVLSARDCARIVEDQGAQFVEEVLNPVPTDLIFARMLHKLYGVLEKAGDFSRCDALLGFIELWDAVEV